MRTWNTVLAGFSLAIVAVFLAETASADIPKKMNYQGRLVAGDSGLPLAGAHNMIFSIYGTPEAGTLLWTESKQVVADSAGVFSTILGSDQPINIAFDIPCWLEVEVDGEILLPRREMVSSAYAFHAAQADTVPALGAAGTINDPTNPVDWTKLKDVPAGFADGVDNVGGGGNRYSLDAVDGAPTDVVYVDGEGRVGVGTITPGEALDIVGSINLTDALKIKGASVVRIDSTNTYLGRNAGRITVGTGNTFLGRDAGYSNESGYGNTFVGQLSGLSNTSGAVNTFLGVVAGSNNKTGVANTFIGGSAGNGNESGTHGTFVGLGAGEQNKSGSANVFIGAGAGSTNQSGSYNICLGTGAGYAVSLGSYNTLVGMEAGAQCSGDGNVFIGHGAGYYEIGSSKLYIANGPDTANVLVYGDFATRRLGIGKMNPGEALDVAGSINLTETLKQSGTVILAANSSNTFVGRDAGASTTGDANTFVGRRAGESNTTGASNVFIGTSAGNHNIGGIVNTFVGSAAGHSNTSGGANTFLGHSAGGANTSGNENTIVGYYAGFVNTTGTGNVFLGASAGPANVSGELNTFVGAGAGSNNTEGSRNVFLGWHAGWSETGSDKLYIANGSYDNQVLVYGDFATRRLGIGTLNPGEALDVAGSVNLTGRLKYNGTAVLTADSNNTCVGRNTGAANLPGLNAFVGDGAGQNNVNGFCNVFVGHSAGNRNEGGQLNTFIGSSAGAGIVGGDGNCFMGWTTGASMTSGGANVYLGTAAGFTKQSGNFNTFLGTNAGYNNVTGDANVFLGSGAGFNETGSNKLYIANGPVAANVLIYGDFSTGRLGLGTVSPERKLHIVGDNPRVLIEASAASPEVNFKLTGDPGSDVWAIYKNSVSEDLRFYQNGDRVTFQFNSGNVAIGAADPLGYRLYVNGTAFATGTWQSSDMRLKTDLEGIDGALGKVMRLSGVSFRWRREENPDRGFPEGRHYGLVAQEVEKVLPEVVGSGPGDEKAVAYTELIPVLVEAVKELKAESDDLRAENERLRQRIDALENARGRQ